MAAKVKKVERRREGGMRMKRLPSLSLAKMESESRRQMNDEAQCARKSVPGRRG